MKMVRLKGLIFNIAIFLLVGANAKRNARNQIEAADLERITEFTDVRVKMNSLFDSFDDVITAQAVRVSEGLIESEDDTFNEKFVELIEEAEDLDDRINQMIRGDEKHVDDDDDDNDDINDSLGKMQVSAAFMVKRASSLLDGVIGSTGSSEEDTTLKESMAIVAEYTKDVLWALKSVETKRNVKVWRSHSSEKQRSYGRNKYSVREQLRKYREEADEDDIDDEEFDSNMQNDDANTHNRRGYSSSSSSSSYVRKEHLTGTPIRRSSYHSSRSSSSGKQNNTIPSISSSSAPSLSSSSSSTDRDSKTARSRHYQNINDRYEYRQQVDSRYARRRPDPRRRPANIRESTTTTRNGHYFDMMTLGNYLRTCSDCAGLTERQQCPMVTEMTDLKKWSEELQDLLSYGCAKPAHCKSSGICCVNRKPKFRETITKMTQMIRELHDMLDRECQEECTKDSCVRDPEWMNWSSWSGCDVTCGQGMQLRRRQCNDTMSNGRTCVGSAVENKECRLASCCVDGVWAGWTTWSGCSVSCGRGMQLRSRQCNGPAPGQCGRPCAGKNIERKNCDSGQACCLDGNWSGWSTWATCSATCGQGLTTRSRRCDNPAPNYCGRKCDGRPDQRRRCGNDKECCVQGNWGSWSGWTSCSVSCGLGSKSRMRRCDNPAPNFCGQRCPGTPRDTQSCNAGQCCVNGNWGQWAAWEGCSATCGRGSEVRRRRCDNPPANSCGTPCAGLPSELRSCQNGPCCVNGNWAPWGGWTRCSVSCGVGSQLRKRVCSNPPPNSCGRPCPGSDEQAKECRMAACPPQCVHGNWAPWSGWSGCSATCGVGLRTKTRQCSNPVPNYCGNKCPGKGELQERCQVKECCVNGNWAPWTGWSSCSASCGVGVRTKTRQCSNPAPNFCGTKCPGEAVDRQRCENRKCCVNGNWAPWSGWSSCSASCGVGVRTKTRQCNNPAPNYCGTKCAGDPEARERCENRKCCVNGNWSPWSGWSACSTSCGVGVRTQTRQCNNPAPNYCGRSCPGRGERSDRCQNKECCVDGKWSPWSRWSSCSVSCGGGIRSKVRECNSPAPNSCGKKCPGKSEAEERCQTRECCVNGNWGLWQGWTSCSVTCGIGQWSRQRRCDSPSPNRCGRPCAGSPMEAGMCDTQTPCCTDGNWSPWQGWSQCSVTCGMGQRSRGRICNSPSPNHCGRPCPGDPMDRATCNSGRPCIVCVNGNWGEWQGWTACSVTCGIGRRSRGRQCNNPAPNQCGRTCVGNSVEPGVCDTQQSCCVNGNWGAWQGWSQCSVTCGMGVTNRRRVCDNPSPNNCGRPCAGNPLESVRCDSQRPCCVDGQWSSWQQWTSCSVSCGKGQRSRGRACNSPAANYCGKPCPGNAIEQTGCQSKTCAVNGNWGTWQPWTQCSVTCGVGHRSRSRACDNPPPSPGARPCSGNAKQKQTCDTQMPCCVDGNWAGWQGWSTCSVTCGIGMRSRGRTCSNPPANHCGKRCPGDSVDRNSCNSGVQCISCVNGNWSPWATWSQCSVSCGLGIQTRDRSCDNPAANFCGRPCSGQPSQSKQCNGGPCCVDGNWSLWGQWTACSVTCGSGFKERERRCDNPSPNQCGQKCAGSNADKTWCNMVVCPTTTTTPPPPRCDEMVKWSQWSPWSVCSVTCETGVQRRVKECLNLMPQSCPTTCPGKDSEEKTCATGISCCVDGLWSPWSPWSGCSVSCGQGQRRRSRACNNPLPNYCGQKCPGLDSATEVCNQTPCSPLPNTGQGTGGLMGLSGDRDCTKVQWSEWSPWASCSVTCGTGTRQRVRDCDNPFPQACRDTKCPGKDTDDAPCVAAVSCCENVKWSKWGKWTPCSATCGTGVRERKRICNNPDPFSCPANKYCRGNAKQIRNCKSKKNCCVDGNWGAWNAWSACSATCGRGSKERRRLCDSPPANYCGRPCVGREYDTETCQANLVCPVVCDERNWSQWTAWTPCSVTCGSSVVQRSRVCDPPTANSCKDACRGDSTDSKLVSCGPDSIDGNWSAWNDDDCRGTCTQGTKYMRRFCNNPAPNYCGKTCPGRATEECDPGLCTQECAMRQWTVWGAWTACSRTCGQGATRTREMQCEFLGGLQGKRDCGQESYRGCRGERKERLPCLRLPLCNGDTTWGEWSSCSATCRGNGVRTRRTMVMTYSGLQEQRGGKEDTEFCSVDSPDCSGPWGPWGPCSATCRGQGIRQRRTIVDLTDLGNIKANATQIQTEACNVDAPACPVWAEWGPCTGTCRGEGVRQRRTIIRANLTDGGVIEASASQTQTETCWYSQGPACAEWTTWSACSATCQGPGVRERILLDYTLPEEQRPRKTESCFGTGPECPNPTGVQWGPWGACSATCRGSGVRIRVSLTRTYLSSEGTWVEANAVHKQTDNCVGTGPECPREASWESWESWCPCGCNNGQRSRRRECTQFDAATGQQIKVDISQCRGEGRQEERCETRGICPECIEKCDGRQDGKYPACSGCRDHMTCRNGQLVNGVIEQCRENEAWDAFINKCVAPPSPSCSLKDCVPDCTNMEDGNYHHCSGCTWYVECLNGIKRDVPCGNSMEFNSFAGKCTFDKSPTCKRSVSGFGIINTNPYGQRGQGTGSQIERIRIGRKGYNYTDIVLPSRGLNLIGYGPCKTDSKSGNDKKSGIPGVDSSIGLIIGDPCNVSTNPNGGSGSPNKPHGGGSGHPSNPNGGGSGYPTNPNGGGSGYPGNPNGGGSGYPSNPNGGGSGYPSNPNGAGSGYPSNPNGGGSGYPSNPNGGGSGYPSNSHGGGSGYPSNHNGGGSGYPSNPNGGGSGYPSNPKGGGSGYPSNPNGGGSGYPSNPHGGGSGYPNNPNGGGSGYPGNQGGSGYPGNQGGSGYPGNQGGSGYPGNQGGSGYPGNQGGSGNPGNHGGSGYPGNQGGSGYPGNHGGSGYPGNQGGSGYPGNHGGSGYPGNQGGSGYPGNHGGSGYPGNQGGSGYPGNQGGSGYPGNQGGSGYPSNPNGGWGPGSGSGFPSNGGAAGLPTGVDSISAARHQQSDDPNAYDDEDVWANQGDKPPKPGSAHSFSVGGHGVSVNQGGTVSQGGSVNQGGTVIYGGSVNQGGVITHGGRVHQGGVIHQGGSVSQGGVITQGGSVSQGGVFTHGGGVSQGGVLSQGGVTHQGGTVIRPGGTIIRQGGTVVRQGGTVVRQGGGVSQGGVVVNQGGGGVIVDGVRVTYGVDQGSQGVNVNRGGSVSGSSYSGTGYSGQDGHGGSHHFTGGQTGSGHGTGQTHVSRKVEWTSGSHSSSYVPSKPSSSSSSSSSSTYVRHAGTHGNVQSVPGLSYKLSQSSPKSGRRQILGCVSDCIGAQPGKYALCGSKPCQGYIVCLSSGRERKRQCYGKKEWDDNIKKCVRRSGTCH